VGVLLLAVGMFRGRDWSAGQMMAGGIILAGFLGVGAAFFTAVKPLSLIRLKDEMSASDQDTRFQLIQATRAMIEDRAWLGFGGGSYRYVAPYYFRELGMFTDPTHYDGLAYAVYHAHCDPLQLAMEYGALGAGTLLLILLYWGARVCRLAGWLGPKGWMALLGPVMVLMHSCLDFPFFNLAVLTLFTLLVVSAVKLAELNRAQEEWA
jgi:O-antigen ligase